MAKLSKKWIALCTVAIGAIYGAGYYSTEAQATQHIASKTPQVHSINTASTSELKKKYKDGIYIGKGQNHRGMIQVKVTIRNEKIESVKIINYDMHYSERYISALPNEVIQNQSPKVDAVSGATYSTRAFHDAVVSALAHSVLAELSSTNTN